MEAAATPETRGQTLRGKLVGAGVAKEVLPLRGKLVGAGVAKEVLPLRGKLEGEHVYPPAGFGARIQP